jgi:DNA-binding HxlR family transcriptional regulator
MDETISPVDAVDCRQISEILGRVGDKWTIQLIVVLHDRTRRFNEIKRAVKGISQQMPTRTLKNSESDGMISRTVRPTVPPQVDYALTTLGRSLAVPVTAIGL